jgi:DNA-binding HxlR family transcriptional regulator
MNKLETKEGCIQAAMNIIGSKWTALILRDLMSGPKRFCELEKSVDGVNPRTLTKRLVALEANGVIAKKIYCNQPLRSDYSLTDKGRDLLPILRAMSSWGEKYEPEPIPIS